MSTTASGPAKTITVTIPRATLWHVITGAIVAVTGVAGIVALTYFPAVSPYRLAVGLGAVVVACGALAYWLWCTLQRSRADEAESHQAIREELATHREEECEHAEQARAAATALMAETEAMRSDFKRLTDQVAELTNVVEVLRDCYLEEGRVQDETPRTSPPREP